MVSFEELPSLPEIFQLELDNDGVRSFIGRPNDTYMEGVMELQRLDGSSLFIKLNKTYKEYVKKTNFQKNLIFSVFDKEIKNFGEDGNHPIVPIRITTHQYRPLIYQHAVNTIKTYAREIIYEREYTFDSDAPYRQIAVRISEYDNTGKANMLAFTNWNSGGHSAILSAGIGVEVCKNGLILGGDATARRVRHTRNIAKTLDEIFKTMEKGLNFKFDDKEFDRLITTKLSKRWQKRFGELLGEYASKGGSTFDRIIQPVTHILTHDDIPFSIHSVLQDILNKTIEIK